MSLKLEFRAHRFVKVGLKFCFVAGLLYFLLSHGLISMQATAHALSQWDKVMPAVIVGFVAACLGVVRWQYLLRVQGIFLSWTRVFELTFIGNFFNVALPGAVSGDIVKALYIGKELKGKKAPAFASILFDRVAGLSALVFVSAGALAMGLQSFMQSSIVAGIGMLLGLSLSAFLLFYVYLFIVEDRKDPILKALKVLQSRFKFFHSVHAFYLSLRGYHHHRITVFKVLILSICIHLLVGWSALQFARALDDGPISLLSIYLVVPLGLLITAVPIAPAGIGTGNVAFLYLFHLIGSEHGGDTFSLMALSNILFGALGGLIYFRFKSHSSHLSLESAALDSAP
jgi:uncharacterized protein (TIRG00374 family)